MKHKGLELNCIIDLLEKIPADFCHNFTRLIKWLSCESDSRKESQTVLALPYLGVRLRDCVSLFLNRFEKTLT